MEIFRYRNLALGCASFLVGLAISFYLPNYIRVAILSTSLTVALAFATIYLINRKKGMLDLIVKYTLLLLFIALSMVVSLIAFNRLDEQKQLYDGKEHTFVGEIVKIEYEKPYRTRSIVKIKELDGEKDSFYVIAETEGVELDKGDRIQAKATLSPLKNTIIGFDERRAYLDDGIVSFARPNECKVIGRKGDNLNFIEKINFNFRKLFKENMSESASVLYSAVVLGDRSSLADTVKRDASRVGVSHALALSGMHITIIATLLGFLFRMVTLPRAPKILLLVLSILFFVLLTGASESAIRAGLMMSLFYVFKIVGKRNDSITALFMAVTTICIVSPYMIFSVSLMLSFLALFACLVATQFIRKIKLRRVKIKPARFILASVLTTFFVIFFTLPIITKAFGEFSLLTPLSNMILVPMFAAIIYLGPVMLAFGGIPFVGELLFNLGERLSDFLLYLIKRLALIDGILVPIYSVIQLIGVLFIVVSLVFLIMSRKKQFKMAAFALTLSSLLFAFGCVYNHIHKASNTYVSTFNYNTSDFVAIEAKNDLTLVDIGESTTGVAEYPYELVSSLNRTEIENYIMTDYSAKANLYFESVIGNIRIDNLYLASPKEDETKIYNEIVKIAKEDNITVFPLEKKVELDGVTLDFSKENTLNRSEKRSVCFNISIGEIDVLYLGASSFEIFDYFTEEAAYNADLVIFGSHGPSYKKIYSYEMPNAEKMVFYGDARRFASGQMLEEYREKIINDEGAPISFKLKRRK